MSETAVTPPSTKACREHSQHNGRKLSDVAAAIVESHLLLASATPLTIQMTDGKSPAVPQG